VNLPAPDPDRPVPFALTPRARAALRQPRPPVVCLCGSTRFHDEFRRANLRLTVAGQMVLSIGCDTKSDGDLADAGELPADLDDLKARLDDLHKRKIDLADYVLVLNVGGYIGASTQSEIAYAGAAGKPVFYLEPPARAIEPQAIPAGQWACAWCADAWFGAPPEGELCPVCASWCCQECAALSRSVTGYGPGGPR
jgi:hypothetical protein